MWTIIRAWVLAALAPPFLLCSRVPSVSPVGPPYFCRRSPWRHYRSMLRCTPVTSKLGRCSLSICSGSRWWAAAVRLERAELAAAGAAVLAYTRWGRPGCSDRRRRVAGHRAADVAPLANAARRCVCPRLVRVNAPGLSPAHARWMSGAASARMCCPSGRCCGPEPAAGRSILAACSRRRSVSCVSSNGPVAACPHRLSASPPDVPPSVSVVGKGDQTTVTWSISDTAIWGTAGWTCWWLPREWRLVSYFSRVVSGRRFESSASSRVCHLGGDRRGRMATPLVSSAAISAWQYGPRVEEEAFRASIAARPLPIAASSSRR